MAHITFSPAARGDLDHTWDYPVEDCGEQQAEKYTRDISAACAAIAEGTAVSRSAEDIRPAYRKLAVGSHLLFSKMSYPTTFDIVRKLHQRMDPRLHL